jgi:hypothetical protein
MMNEAMIKNMQMTFKKMTMFWAVDADLNKYVRQYVRPAVLKPKKKNNRMVARIASTEPVNSLTSNALRMMMENPATAKTRG